MLDHGLLHGDVQTVWGPGLDRYRIELGLEKGATGPRPPRAMTKPCFAPRPTPSNAPAACACWPATSGGRSSRPPRSTPAGTPSKPRHAGQSGSPPGRVQSRKSHRRLHRGALPGPSRQRHARAAPPHTRAVHPAGPGAEGGPGHRRSDVGRVGQGSVGHPRRPKPCWVAPLARCGMAISCGSTP